MRPTIRPHDIDDNVSFIVSGIGETILTWRRIVGELCWRGRLGRSSFVQERDSSVQFDQSVPCAFEFKVPPGEDWNMTRKLIMTYLELFS